MKTVQNDLDSHGLSWTDAVDLAGWPRTDHSGGCWRPVALYTLVVVQAGDDDEIYRDLKTRVHSRSFDPAPMTSY